LKIVQYLPSNVTDFAMKGWEKEIPLHWEAEKGHLKIVKYFLDHNIEINAEGFEMMLFSNTMNS
jgi:ankyrin repeat protein